MEIWIPQRIDFTMTDAAAIRQSILAAVRAKGFRVEGISIEVTEAQLRLSGEVESYYAIQMIQHLVPALYQNHEVVLDLRVQPSNGHPDRRQLSDPRSPEVHRLRNRLHELTTGLKLLQKLLQDENISAAQELIGRLMANNANRENADA
jgi:hypothetical protein